MSVCVLMAGAGLTALRTSMTVPQQHAVLAPHVSTVLHLLSVSAPMERQVGLKNVLHKLLLRTFLPSISYSISYCSLFNCSFAISCSWQDSCATLMMLVSLIPVEGALSVTPTPSVACLTVTVHLDILASPAILTEMNVVSVSYISKTHVKLHLCSRCRAIFSSSSTGTNPCEHGGQCVNTEGSFTCNCVKGYAGPRCEQDVNECASNPCQNDGTCLDRIGDYTCICMPGILPE